MSNEQKQGSGSKSRGPGKVWLPIVLVIGGLLGVLAYQATISEAEIFYRIPFRGHNFLYEALRAFHIILSTVGIALIIALIGRGVGPRSALPGLRRRRDRPRGGGRGDRHRPAGRETEGRRAGR